MLGIKENNIPGPNAAMIELKSARKNAKSMLTLFTRSPLTRKVNSVLLQRFGYPSARGNDRKELHTTINGLEFNSIKGKPGFKIDIQEENINMIILDGEIVCYWNRILLQKAFKKKLPKLLYVKAETRGRASEEEYWYNEAWLLGGFDFENFVKLLKQGIILIDIRIGQYKNGRTHDHGIGFRIFPDKLDLCFEHRERII